METKMRLHNWNYVVRLVSGKTQIQCLVTRKDCTLGELPSTLPD